MIKEFQKQYRWLSNFAPCEIWLEGRKYSSVEHAYMSAKSNDEDWKILCQNTKKPGDVKRASRKIQLRPDWESKKTEIMKECIDQKFNQEPYKTKLLQTGNEYIQEGNRWGDEFWGVNLKNGKGKNILGKLIMEKRTKLKEK